jgi:uncharacterized repeat protein (TIGR03943 family)
MKRYLGIICIIYSAIFSYVIFFDKIKNFLAPQMQIYIKIAIIPLLIIGIVMLLNKDVHYRFKISDLILLLPLVLLIIASDGRLSSNFASNRTANLNNRTKIEQKEEKVVEPTDNKEPVTPSEGEKPSYDFTNAFFEIDDKNYSELSSYISFAPKATKFTGKTIKVKGFILEDASYLPENYFGIGKYVISCCVADATFTGFIVKNNGSEIKEGNWYEIEGILEPGVDAEGYNIMYINIVNIKEINPKSEEQYVYPCYTFDDGVCKEVTKYGLEY